MSAKVEAEFITMRRTVRHPEEFRLDEDDAAAFDLSETTLLRSEAICGLMQTARRVPVALRLADGSQPLQSLRTKFPERFPFFRPDPARPGVWVLNLCD